MMPEAGISGVVRAVTVAADRSKSSMIARVAAYSVSPDAMRSSTASSMTSSGGMFCPGRFP
jgi:hypothetical protein